MVSHGGTPMESKPQADLDEEVVVRVQKGEKGAETSI